MMRSSRRTGAGGAGSRCRLGRATVSIVALLVVCGAALLADPARGQDEAAALTWAKLESAKETGEFREKLRGGGGIDAAARQFLEQVALPQLALDGNRDSITTVRKRLREYLLNDIADEKVGDDANRVYLGFMTALAAKEDEPAVVRVNAMLLIGELHTAGGVGRKPWPGAIATLAKSAADPMLPKELRIAAAAGLSRHADAAKGNPALLGRFSKDAAPPLASIVKELAGGGGGPESDWLLSRCLSMLGILGPPGQETVAEVVRSLQSPQLSFDTRVRAATALAAITGPQSSVDDAAAIVRTIEDLAVASLQRDADNAERRKLERLFSGEAGLARATSGGGPGAEIGGMRPGAPGSPGPGPGGVGAPGLGAPGGSGFPGSGGGPAVSAQSSTDHVIPTEVCRRAAWRLSSLANAVLTADGKRGVQTLIQDGDAAEKAKSLAENLRYAANALDANPVAASLLEALADLKPKPPAAEGDAGPAATDADKPEDPPSETDEAPAADAAAAPPAA